MLRDTAAAPSARLGFIDGFRGLAILMVVCYHGYEAGGMLPTTIALPGMLVQIPDVLSKTGGLGVEVFYFVSGFCLFYPYAQHVFGLRPMPRLLHYIERRSIKIVPSYVLALTFFTLFFPLEVPQDQNLLSHYLAHLFFLHGLRPDTFISIAGPLWSLAVEVEFYFLFPLIAYYFIRRPKATMAALVAISIAYRICIDRADLSGQFFWTYQLPDFLDIFGFGMLAAWYAVKYHVRPPRRARPRTFTALAIAGVLTFWGIMGTMTTVGGPSAWAFLNSMRDVLGLVLFVIALGTTLGSDLWQRVLANPFLTFLSTISYNLYLWNKNLIVWYKSAGAPTVGAFPYGGTLNALCVLTLSVGVAVAVTYGIERPLLRGGWPLLWRWANSLWERLPAGETREAA